MCVCVRERVNVCGCFGFDFIRLNDINGFNSEDDDEDVDSNGSDKIQNDDAECVFARVFTSEVETVD